jgi:transposase-like protein
MEETTIPGLASRIPTENAAYRLLESMRWKGHPACPHCRKVDGHRLLKARRKTTTGKTSQRRTWKCGQCKRQFSVLVGTVFHGSHIPIRTWLFVLFEMVASKNGIAAREIARKYGITVKSAWHMTQRIREAMTDHGIDLFVGTIAADETWVGGVKRVRPPHGLPDMERRKYIADRMYDNKTPVLSILNRTTGEVRSRVVPNVTQRDTRRRGPQAGRHDALDTPHRRVPRLHRSRPRVRRSRDGQPPRGRVRPRRRHHERCGVVLRAAQAQH